MNWEAITAMAETAGVIGVILSIVYLSIQVRHSNQVSADAAFKNTLALSISSHHEMIEGKTEMRSSMVCSIMRNCRAVKSWFLTASCRYGSPLLPRPCFQKDWASLMMNMLKL